MADFYLDHNVPAQIADLLNARGHDAIPVGVLGLARAPDSQLLLFAAQDRRILITHNRKDFILLHHAWLRWSAAWGVTASHAGILVTPTRPTWDPQRAAQEIDAFIHAGYPMSDRLYHWRSSRGWVEY